MTNSSETLPLTHTRTLLRQLEEGTFEPSGHCYTEDDFDGYHAAPLLLIGDDADASLIKRQDELAWKFADVVYEKLGTSVKDPIKSFAARSIVSRLYEREGLNSISYLHREFERPQPALVDTPLHLARLACKKVTIGQGTIEQNDTAFRELGMHSGELANLTIFNEFRKDLEVPMWQEMSDFLGKNASPTVDDIYRYKLLGFDRDIFTNQHVGAMRIGTKRLLGTLDDGTKVKARTTAIINTSPSSGFDQDILERFKSYGDEEYPLDTIAQTAEYQNAVRWLVSSRLEPGIVLARNETIYEVRQ